MPDADGPRPSFCHVGNLKRWDADGINGLVLDAELVAVDRSDGKLRLRAFQELSTRARGGVTTDQVGPPLSIDRPVQARMGADRLPGTVPS